ncbi:MAG: hypothetical protein LM583_11040 [Desulfurococcaceae archaeon]|nr:hypothetical protein [Desulfurococcaceae archaeon]
MMHLNKNLKLFDALGMRFDGYAYNMLLHRLSTIFEFLSNIPFIRDLPLVFADEEGFRFYAKIQDWWRFSKPFEPLTYKFLTSNTESSDIFLDVGAHIGLYTIRLAEEFQKIHRFEGLVFLIKEFIL